MASFYPLRTINSVIFEVSTSSQLVLPANPHRKFAILVNDSNANIYIKFGLPAVLHSGVRISSNGFSYEIDNTNLWVGDIFAIHDGSGTKKLLIEEFT